MTKKKLTDSELLIKYSKYDDYMKAVAERNEALRAAGSPWVDAPLKTETGAYKHPNPRRKPVLGICGRTYYPAWCSM